MPNFSWHTISADMRNRTKSLLASAVLAVAVASPSIAAEQVGPYEWQNVERLVVFGDVHGSYDKLVTLLQRTETIDADLAWSGGEAHVVFCGDLVDRGPNERPVLDLIRRLETEAEAAGGRIHVLIGNHEVLNIVGDLRYIEGNGFSDFAAEETAADRKAGFEAFRADAAKAGVTGRQVNEAFEQRFPAGHFARLRAFDVDGEYGAWLMSKPAVVKINGYVFLHGGLTDEVAALGLDGINEAVKESVQRFAAARKTVADGALLTYRETIAAAETLAANKAAQRRSPEKVDAAGVVLAHYDGMAFAPGGPLWYRGNSVENERVERASLDRVLDSLGAEGVVVGHTPTGTGQVTSRFNGKIYRVDVGMAYGRDPLCMEMTDGRITAFNPRDDQNTAIPMEPPGGERYSDIDEQLPDKQIERFLRTADLVRSKSLHNVIREEPRHGQVWDLESKQMDMRALFQAVDEPLQADGSAARRYVHEIAAYKLDRILELNFVPVAVIREIEGKPGSLQVWIHSAIDLPEIREYARTDVIEAIRSQVWSVRIFSALIGARIWDRADAGYMALPLEKRVLVMDNTKAFPTSTDVEEILFPEDPVVKLETCELDEHLELMMHKLQRSALKKELGKYLDDGQIDAIFTRRDRIIEICGD